MFALDMGTDDTTVSGNASPKAAPAGLPRRSLLVAPAALLGLGSWTQASGAAPSAPDVLRVAPTTIAAKLLATPIAKL